ncbi:MAG: M48 family metalloprotease [Sphingobacteriales bacterium]|nr:M48 family metalloprotease [Sphingobacteriales bacterium]
MFRKIAAIALHLCFCVPGISQPAAIYSFPLEDSTLKNQLYNAALSKKNALIASLDKEHKEDYQGIYEERFEVIATLMKSSRLVAEPDAHQYLQQVLDRIVSVNDELKPLSIRLVFSRDWWPNACSVGEGTLIVNAGLLVRLKNESELTFVLCHELAHFYLDHAGKSIRKNISTLNSEAFRSELKKLAKQEYGAGAGLEKLFRMLAFGFRRHSRENEAEADEMAIQFLRKTGFSGQGAISCLQMLDKVDDSSYYAGPDLPVIFNFPDYYFKKRWIQNESMIFSEMKGDASALTEAERDSLRTHPDCPKRIATLEPVVLSFPAGRDFLVDAATFNRLKDRFSVEIIEELYREEQYSLNLYYALGLLKSGQHRSYAIYSVARVLNGLYDAQLNHRFGLVTEKENRTNSGNYNLLLRMLDRVRLDELAALSYYFCTQFRQEMAGYTAFEAEWKKAQENKVRSTH